MSRRTRFEPENNHDRWMVSYADFVTLLFAFFVVMYSISSVNEDKYRVLSSAMSSAFNDQPVVLHSPAGSPLVTTTLLGEFRPQTLQSSEGVMVPLRLDQEPVKAPPEDVAADREDRFMHQALNAAEAEIGRISDSVEERMQPSIEKDLISVTRNKFWLEVEIKSSLLFDSGSSALIPSSVPLLIDLAYLFADMPNRIHVEGFTDDQPIRTPLFPSNWELSSARAAAVVRLFERNGIESERLASIGYGEYRPLVANDSEEARAKNRRVVVVVLAALEGGGADRIHEFEILKERSLAHTAL